jgi:hypothetical protein
MDYIVTMNIFLKATSNVVFKQQRVNKNLITKTKPTMEFYSVTKKNEILSFAGNRMELKNIILSEVSKT